MPIFDVKCKSCEKEKEVWLKVDELPPKCDCGGEMFKICNCISHKLIYNPKTDICSWGNEGYATTQRYRYVDKNKVKE